MEFEKVSLEEFERMKERAINDPIEKTGQYGSYRSYFIRKVGSKEIVGYNEYISEADGFPSDRVEFESEQIT